MDKNPKYTINRADALFVFIFNHKSEMMAVAGVYDLTSIHLKLFMRKF